MKKTGYEKRKLLPMVYNTLIWYAAGGGPSGYGGLPWRHEYATNPLFLSSFSVGHKTDINIPSGGKSILPGTPALKSGS